MTLRPPLFGLNLISGDVAPLAYLDHALVCISVAIRGMGRGFPVWRVFLPDIQFHQVLHEEQIDQVATVSAFVVNADGGSSPT
jgi:hypothetical protein